MATLDMATITEYLERSMKNCSLSSDQKRRSEMIDENEDKTLDLSSDIPVPSHLEQCLDLKTGEIYYINRIDRGMGVKGDSRKLMSSKNEDDESSGDQSYGSMFSEEDKNSYYESEESSSEASPPLSREIHKGEEDVLVVAGCKACFMYFMVPKTLEDCPKCASHLLHFGQPDHSASP